MAMSVLTMALPFFGTTISTALLKSNPVFKYSKPQKGNAFRNMFVIDETLKRKPAASIDPRAGITANSVNFFTCMLWSVENKEK